MTTAERVVGGSEIRGATAARSDLVHLPEVDPCRLNLLLRLVTAEPATGSPVVVVVVSLPTRFLTNALADITRVSASTRTHPSRSSVVRQSAGTRALPLYRVRG